ncbi:uncharacterized protein LOC110456033 [Mizuhopecten yessoensis]|uniref:Threonylcarbamoyl-AMP synthase n=1 Tax=Mizuhopecten yessoensis TaxID=6573 RepID=A0A210QBT4_MIZYE|nr:uncharacterized protein LOC110456033 [Mizuhopecten yessoensis]OWF46190.1 tRNA threonylcarbamoyladenosine biosynthesis protein YwlC [Mizuhopecten yessoensis]
MAGIHVDAAAAAGFLLVSLLFALTSVNTITAKQSEAIIDNIPYGSTLVALSLAILLTGMTSPFPHKQLLQSVVLCLAVLWSSVGVNHIWTEVNYSQNLSSEYYVSSHEALFPGYGGLMLVFLVFLGTSLTNRDFRSCAAISVICLVLFTFEIINMFVSVQGTGVLHVLLTLIFLYFCLSNISTHYKRSNTISPDDAKLKSKPQKNAVFKDHLVMMYALNVVCFTIFASHVINIISDTRFSFPWLLTSGIFQVVVGIASLRKSDPNSSGNVVIFGLFWIGVGSSLMVENYLWKEMNFIVPTSAVLALIFCLVSIVEIKVELFRSLYFVMMAMFTISLGVDGLQGVFVGVMGWVGMVLSLYGLVATTTRLAELEITFPLGNNIMEKEKVKHLFSVFQNLGKTRKTEDIWSDSNKLSGDIMLGYSKYVDSQCVGFAANAVAAFSLIWIPSGSDPLILPWTVGFGGLIQFAVGFVSFSRGLTFESCSFLLYASFWSIWGSVRALSVIEGAEGPPLVVGLVGFLVIGVLFLGLSTTVSKIWMMTSSVFCLLVVAFMLHGLNASNYGGFEIAVAIAYVLICTYGVLSTTLRNVWGRDILPEGKPILQVSKLYSDRSQAVFMDPRRATGVKQAAEILKDGGTCGIPSDTVYVFVAACNQPQAVERAYNSKKDAEDRPMSVWISNIKQIEKARAELGDVCWNFMQEVWPSNISLVLKKGEWVKLLGLGDSERLIGKPDSIAIRIPDNTIVCHLIDQTGPIAVTSANPTGEADTTHHLHVLARLGVKHCDGILADGPSPENAASTVVDCRKVEEGKIGFFRIGLTPKSIVEEMFNKARSKKCTCSSQDNISDSGTSSIGLDNPGFDESDLNQESDVQAFVQSPALVHSAKTIGGKLNVSESHTNPIYVDTK